MPPTSSGRGVSCNVPWLRPKAVAQRVWACPAPRAVSDAARRCRPASVPRSPPLPLPPAPPLRIPLRVPMPRATSLEQPGSHLHFSLCVLVSKVRLRTRAEETCPPTLSSRRFPGVYRVQACCLYRNHKILVQTTLPGFCAAVSMGIICPCTIFCFTASTRRNFSLLCPP